MSGVPWWAYASVSGPAGLLLVWAVFTAAAGWGTKLQGWLGEPCKCGEGDR